MLSKIQIYLLDSMEAITFTYKGIQSLEKLSQSSNQSINQSINQSFINIK